MTAVSVFGATGFVGSHFCRDSRHDAVAVPRDERAPPSDDVLYLLSTTHNYWIYDDVHRDIDTNLTILVDVLEAWRARDPRGVFNYMSSWFVYGRGPLPASESMPCWPRGWYDVTKYAAEQMVRTYCEVHDLQYRILRGGSVYGPGDPNASARKNALHWLIAEMAAGRPIRLYYGGDFTRDFLYVDDFVRAIDVCLDRGPVNSIINVGSGVPTRFGDMIRLAAIGMDYTQPIGSMEPSKLHTVVGVKDFWLDTTRLRSLGFKPRVSMSVGLSRLCASILNERRLNDVSAR